MLARFAALGGAISALSVSDVFSTTLYTGNNANRTVENGLDLSGNGGLVWIKSRTSTVPFQLFDTQRGPGVALASNDTTGQASNTAFTGFLSNGFSLGVSVSPHINYSGNNYASWSFRNSNKFFSVQTIVKEASPQSIDLSHLGIIGQVFVKRVDAVGYWYGWHRGLSAGKNIQLQSNVGESTSGAYIDVSGSNLVITASLPAGTYIVYAFAHSDDADGIIRCGTFVTNSSGVGIINTGWVNGVQFLMIKMASSTGDWEIIDTARTPGFVGSDSLIRANLTAAEVLYGRIDSSTDTMTLSALGKSSTYIYMAIAAP